MAIMTTKVFIFSCAISLIMCESIKVNLENQGANTTMLQFITAVEGKSYFQDSSTARDWEQSRDFCVSLGMRLASIETRGQFDALNQKYSDAFLGHFWVSGRDKLDSTQFVWDFTETEVPTNIPYDRHIYDFPYQTCLRYASNPDNKSHLYPRQCNQKANRLICETS